MKNKDRTYCIYVIKNNFDDMVYVGRTCDIKMRWSTHNKPSVHKRCSNNPLYQAMDTYGRDSFWYEILEDNLSYNEACMKEGEWTLRLNSKYPNGYNLQIADKPSEDRITKLKEVHTGSHRSEASKQKMRDNHYDCSGEKHPMYGRHHAEESKKKMSESHKGQYPSEEARRKMSESRKGKRMGKDNPMFGRTGGKNPNAKKVRCIDNGMIFDCCGDAGKWCGVGARAISKCCRGECKTAGNYKWEYLKEKCL